MSASCSMAPDSRRSDITGFLFSRCSTPRFSCDSAMTGQLQLFGQRLETARDLRDLGGAVLLRARHRHELKIVDHDQVETVFALDAPRSCAQFRRSQRRRVVDEYLGVLELLGGASDARPVVLGEFAAADVAEVHAAHRREHAREDLIGGHFQREDGDRRAYPLLQRGVLGHVDGQRGLAHRRPARNDQQIAAAQPAGDFVEIDEARGQAARLVRIVVQIVDLIDQRRQRLLRAHVTLAARAAFGDGEDACARPCSTSSRADSPSSVQTELAISPPAVTS